MKKPYEQGYYDGYRDCKCFYEKLLREIEEDRKNDKDHIKLLEYNLNYALREDLENRKFIALGKAVKTIIQETKN